MQGRSGGPRMAAPEHGPTRERKEAGPMCGIVGYVGQRPVQEILLEGLQKLEYRGYDSAGISIQSEGELESVRAVGNLSALRAAVQSAAEHDGGSVAVAAP